MPRACVRAFDEGGEIILFAARVRACEGWEGGGGRGVLKTAKPFGFACGLLKQS